MKIHSMNHLKNTLLIAMPSMEDTWFHQALILMCEHDDQGSIGITVNKPAGMQLGELFEQMDIECQDVNLKGQPVYKGGPVQGERGFVLHTSYRDTSGTQKLGENLYISTSRDILLDIAQGVGPEQFIVALGYSGWSKNQLVEEMWANSWLNSSSSNQLIFEEPVHSRWHAAVRSVGIDMNALSLVAGHA